MKLSEMIERNHSTPSAPWVEKAAKVLPVVFWALFLLTFVVLPILRPLWS